MDMTIPPKKEILDFCQLVLPWVEEAFPDPNTPKLKFKKETPISVLKLFDEIKDVAGFDYAK